MKKIKKLLLPLASIAASAAIVAPLLTSCGVKPAASTEVPRDYTPSMTKHEAALGIKPETAAQEYLKAIKQNPSIANEDYKFTAGQLYEAISEVFEWLPFANGSTIEPELTINSLKAGLTDLSFNDEKGLFSYRNGMTVNATASMDIDFDDLFSTEGIGEYEVVVNANNFGFETTFVNFDAIDVTHETSFLDGDYTLIKPIFPLDLTNKDWSVNVKIFGGLTVAFDGSKIIDVDNINIDWTFNNKNIGLLFLFQSAGRCPIDIIQELGSFASYYMSDVVCMNRFYATSDIVDVKYTKSGFFSSEWWEGQIEYNNLNDIDYTKCDAHSTYDNKTITFKQFREGSKSTTCAHIVRISNTLDTLPIYNNTLEYFVGKYRENDKYQGATYEWKERHAITPRFVQELTNNSGTWTGAATYYGFGTLCKFDMQLTNTETIAKNAIFDIGGTDANGTPFYIPFALVTVTKDGKALTSDDYQISADGRHIQFLKAITGTAATPVNISIELTTLSTIKYTYDTRVTPNLTPTA